MVFFWFSQIQRKVTPQITIPDLRSIDCIFWSPVGQYCVLAQLLNLQQKNYTQGVGSLMFLDTSVNSSNPVDYKLQDSVRRIPSKTSIIIIELRSRITQNCLQSEFVSFLYQPIATTVWCINPNSTIKWAPLIPGAFLVVKS